MASQQRRIGPVLAESVEGFREGRFVYFVEIRPRFLVGVGDRTSVEAGFGPEQPGARRRIAGPAALSVAIEWRRR